MQSWAYAVTPGVGEVSKTASRRLSSYGVFPLGQPSGCVRRDSASCSVGPFATRNDENVPLGAPRRAWPAARRTQEAAPTIVEDPLRVVELTRCEPSALFHHTDETTGRGGRPLVEGGSVTNRPVETA
jgi:hypothetical protein